MSEREGLSSMDERARHPPEDSFKAQVVLRPRANYCRTGSGAAVAPDSVTPSKPATVGAICRMSTIPRSRCRAIPDPAMKSDERISGDSGVNP